MYGVCVSGVRMETKRKPIDGELFLADDVCKVQRAVKFDAFDDTKLEEVASGLSSSAKEWTMKSDHKLAFLQKEKIGLTPLRGTITIYQIFANDEHEPRACIEFFVWPDQFELHKRVYTTARGKGVVEPFNFLWNEGKQMGAIVTAPFGRSLADVSSNNKLKDRFRRNVGGYFAEIPSCLQALQKLNIDASFSTLKSAANFVECDGVWKLSNFWGSGYRYVSPLRNVQTICQLVRQEVLPFCDKQALGVQLTSSLIDNKVAQVKPFALV